MSRSNFNDKIIGEDRKDITMTVNNSSFNQRNSPENNSKKLSKNFDLSSN